MKKIHQIFFIAAVLLLSSCGSQSGSDNQPVPEENLMEKLNLSNYTAVLNNASSLGIVKRSQPMKRRDGSDSEQSQNILVKTVTEFDARDPKLNSDGTVDVTFSKIDTTITTTTVSGSYSVVATKKESNSEDAYVSCVYHDGFSYSLYKDNEPIVENIEKNDTNSAYFVGNSVYFDGLEEGKTYEISYSGIGEEIVSTQSEVPAEIDKVYVYSSRFTFLSFVPIGTSRRPDVQSSKVDTDRNGIPLYDKQEYYTSKDRVSFIVDNQTGFFYLIENFYIQAIYNNLLVTNKDHLVYDFKINENDELVIFPLFTNESIKLNYFFKDKYGNRFICNEKINEYDEENNTTFFVSSQQGLAKQMAKETGGWRLNLSIFDGINDRHQYFYFTSDGRALFTKNFSIGDGEGMEIYTIGPSREKIPLQRDEEFFVCIDYIDNNSLGYLVKNGNLFWIQLGKRVFSDQGIACYDFINQRIFSFDMEYWIPSFKYFQKTGLLVVYSVENHSVFSTTIQDVLDFLLKEECTEETSINGQHVDLYPNYRKEEFDLVNKTLVIENINLENDSLVKISATGNTYYDIYLEMEDNEYVIKADVVGSHYVAPEVVVLQPIR